MNIEGAIYLSKNYVVREDKLIYVGEGDPLEFNKGHINRILWLCKKSLSGQWRQENGHYVHDLVDR